MGEAWTVSPTANGINVIDENGLPVCTRVGLDDANLIASAPRLAEQVRILREALKDAHEGLDSAARYLDKLDSETVVEAVEKGLEQAHAALEATKEKP